MSDSETQVWEDEEMNTQDPSLDEALDDMFPTDEPVEIMAAEADHGVSLDAELDNMFPTDDEPAAFAAEAPEDVAEEVAEAAAEEVTEEAFEEVVEMGAEEIDAYPAFDEPEEETFEEAVEAAVVETVAVVEDSFDAPESVAISQGADDFNLATLNQLVDEIRQESQRVSDMKASVAKALSLIQEMSESLKP